MAFGIEDDAVKALFWCHMHFLGPLLFSFLDSTLYDLNSLFLLLSLQSPCLGRIGYTMIKSN